MTAQELKPCPFCGGHPTLTKHHREDIWNLIHRCEVVGAVSFDWGTAERHAARWNRRAQPVARTPLSDEEITAAAIKAGIKPIYDKPKVPMVNALGSSVPFRWLKSFAHGIKQEKQG